jgi:hypothetical protein
MREYTVTHFLRWGIFPLSQSHLPQSPMAAILIRLPAQGSLRLQRCNRDLELF